jgi:hypothetical protein
MPQASGVDKEYDCDTHHLHFALFNLHFSVCTDGTGFDLGRGLPHLVVLRPLDMGVVNRLLAELGGTDEQSHATLDGVPVVNKKQTRQTGIASLRHATDSVATRNHPNSSNSARRFLRQRAGVAKPGNTNQIASQTNDPAALTAMDATHPWGNRNASAYGACLADPMHQTFFTQLLCGLC